MFVVLPAMSERLNDATKTFPVPAEFPIQIFGVADAFTASSPAARPLGTLLNV
jgi:hypothetical protein